MNKSNTIKPHKSGQGSHFRTQPDNKLSKSTLKTPPSVWKTLRAQQRPNEVKDDAKKHRNVKKMNMTLEHKEASCLKRDLIRSLKTEKNTSCALDDTPLLIKVDKDNEITIIFVQS